MDIFTFLLLVIIFFALAGLRVVDQYERGVVLTLGKYTGTRTPGLTWIFIGIQKMTKEFFFPPEEKVIQCYR